MGTPEDLMDEARDTAAEIEERNRREAEGYLVRVPSREFLEQMIAGYFCEFSDPVSNVPSTLAGDKKSPYHLAAKVLADRILGEAPCGHWPGGCVEYLRGIYGKKCAGLAPRLED